MAYGSLLADVVKSSSSSPVTFQNTSGTEIGTLCRAWVNFNGTGTVAIRASFNVSSITDNGTGDYTVNFTTAMPDVNYAPVFGFSNGNDGRANVHIHSSSATASPTLMSTTQLRMQFDTTSDVNVVAVSIFR